MKHRILIVEDEQVLADAMREFLLCEGYDVDCAAEREEAEALLAHYNYSLVITDLALSPLGLSGVNILDILADQAKRPKVIVYSGQPVPDLESLLGSGRADVFLQKPQSLEKVARIARDLIGCAP